MAFCGGAVTWVDKNRATAITYLDMCRAFETALNDILLSKQERRDLTAGPLGEGVAALKVTLKGLWSVVQMPKWRTVVSGVPQRLVLGPEQFNIFVSDMRRGEGEFLGM